MARFLCVLFLGAFLSGCGLFMEQLAVVPVPGCCVNTHVSDPRPATLAHLLAL